MQNLLLSGDLLIASHGLEKLVKGIMQIPWEQVCQKLQDTMVVRNRDSMLLSYSSCWETHSPSYPAYGTPIDHRLGYYSPWEQIAAVVWSCQVLLILHLKVKYKLAGADEMTPVVCLALELIN